MRALAQQYVSVKNLTHEILILDGEGFSPRAIADRLSTTTDYVRAVRGRHRRGRVTEARQRPFDPGRQANLRVLALKLYEMRQGGVL